MTHYSIPRQQHRRLHLPIRSVANAARSDDIRTGRLSWGVFVGLMVSVPVWALAAVIMIWLT